MSQGSLVIVGTGIRTVGHLTVEAIAWMRAADKLLYLVADPVAEELVRRFNPRNAESLYGFYGEGKIRLDSYTEMVNRILECVREGHRTCVAFYGHPGIFVYPSHEAIRIAREEGFAAALLPGISAEDCLFADLGVDPASSGCQSYEATDFMISNRQADPSSAVVLWQIGVVGNWVYNEAGFDLASLPLLLERLYEKYPRNHRVCIYEAAIHVGCPPLIEDIALSDLVHAELSASSTLFIPPAQPTVQDAEVLAKLRAFLTPANIKALEE